MDASSPPLSHITEGSDVSTSAPLALMHSHSSSSVSPIHPSSLQSSPSISSVREAAEPSSSFSGRFASVASSGVSLFGISRLNGTSEGAMGRERSDSDSSSFAPGSTNNRISAIEEDDEDELQPPPPPIQVPRNFRARERRRVNISGRMLVPIAEPVHEEEMPSVPASAAPHPSSAPNGSPTRPRANTDPISPPDADLSNAVESPGPSEGTSSIERKRKVSAPSLMLSANLPAAHDAPPSAPSSAPASPPQHLRPKPQPPPPPRTPVRQHHAVLSFAKRSDIPTSSAPAAPKRSALTALLTAKEDSPSASNPFSQLYAALVSRGSDALKLTIYFPQSQAPSKKLKIAVKKDLTVEEVIGAGLWAYWEEGREPKLGVGDREQEHDETTKWNLRIVEDDGEVDEDFPGESSALQRPS